jgi:hypothetical protein
MLFSILIGIIVQYTLVSGVLEIVEAGSYTLLK